MGMGDWILATSQVKQIHAATGKQVAVVDQGGRLKWSEVFANNPKIATRLGPNIEQLVNCGGHRPYIAAKLSDRWVWKDWDIQPGEIFLSGNERAFAWPHGGRILIEPNTKVPGSNKSYEWSRWQSIVDAFPPGAFIQVGSAGTRQLERVHYVATPTFRHACAVLAGSRALVSTEGGLGHAAAALGIPAVILFSGFISPKVTGYSTHVNIYKGQSELGCGSRVPCSCCRDSMAKIHPEEVIGHLRRALG